MKRVVLLILFVMLSFMPFTVDASEDEFIVNITTESITPDKVYVGDTVTIMIAIENVSISEDEKMWDPILFIDADFLDPSIRPYISLGEPDGVSLTYTGHAHIGDNIWPGDTIYGALTFTIAPDAPGGDYRIPVVLVGSRGKCTSGCSPFREGPLYVPVNVYHGLPAISISFDGYEPVASVDDTLAIGFTVKNVGTADASSISASIVSQYPGFVGQATFQDAVDELLPNDTASGTVAILGSGLEPGDYSIDLRIDYVDGKGSSYYRTKELAFTLTESAEATYEELGDQAMLDGQQAMDSKDYSAAVKYFARAEAYYSLGGFDEKASTAGTSCSAALDEKVSSEMPPPVACESHSYYLPVGLVVGALALFVGLVIGVRKK